SRGVQPRRQDAGLRLRRPHATGVGRGERAKPAHPGRPQRSYLCRGVRPRRQDGRFWLLRPHAAGVGRGERAEPAHPGGPQRYRLGVAFSPDGKTLVSGSWDHTLRVWPLLRGNDLIEWTLANRYVPELTEEQRQRYGLAQDATPTAATPAPAR